MPAIATDQKHTKETFLYAGSRALERASYYGIRSLLVLYMIRGSLHLPRETAMQIYGCALTCLIFSQVIGAVIGDLLLGNKKALLLGGLLQAIGAFTLCIPSTIGLYIGVGLIVLGGGLYTPNILSRFGKIYLNKTELLDGGFTLFYTAVNLGSFLGIFIMSYFGEPNYIYGFIIGGIFMLLSITLPLLSKEEEEIPKITESKNTTSGILTIVISILLIGIFWGVFDFAGNGLVYLDLQFAKNLNTNNLFSTYSSSPVLIVGISFAIIWSYFYVSHLLKAVIGFVLATISLGLLLLIPADVTQAHVLIFILSLILFSMAEFFINPMLYSILTKHSNPKYLAILMSITFIPSKVIMYLTGICSSYVNEQPIISITIGGIILGLIGISLTVLLVLTKNEKSFAS